MARVRELVHIPEFKSQELIVLVSKEGGRERRQKGEERMRRDRRGEERQREERRETEGGAREGKREEREERGEKW